MLLVSFYINYKKVFELVLTGDNAENTKNTAIHWKYTKYNLFVENADSAKYCKENNFFLDFYKLHKVLSVSAKFPMFGVLPSQIK